MIQLRNSTNALVSQNEIEGTTSTMVANGISLERQVTNSIVEKNFLHDMDHSGVGVQSYGAVTRMTQGNQIRFNVIANAGGGQYGSIQFWSDNGMVDTNYIYNNTVVTPFGKPSVEVSFSKNTFLFNNLFVHRGGGAAITAYGNVSGSTLRYNSYFEPDGTAEYYWIDASYTNIGSLAAGKGLEKNDVGTTIVGKEMDPLLVGPLSWSTALSNTAFSSLTQFMLQPSSPLRGAGNNLTTRFGFSMGSTDFFGNAIAPSSMSMGAHQPQP